MSSEEEHEDEVVGQWLNWQQQRRTDVRLLKLFTLTAVLCGLGMYSLPSPWRWWFLVTGIALVVLGTLVDLLWVGPRQIRRLREMGRRKDEIIEQMQEEPEGPEEPTVPESDASMPE